MKVAVPGPLLILPSLTAVPAESGRMGITTKFLEGVEEFVRHWTGPVTVLIEAAANAGNNLDNTQILPSEMPFKIKLADFDRLEAEPDFLSAGVIVATACHRQNHVGSLAAAKGIPCVYVTEYSLKTCEQIIDAETRNPLLRLRRKWWARRHAKRELAAIRQAAGVQCNGTPTYDVFRQANANSLLYFDTRVTRSMLIGREQLKVRLASTEGQPLRLLFSGRLIAMKGADDLIAVARELKAMGVPFQLTICGDGDLAPTMRQQIAAWGLNGCVHLAGVLDFHKELIPHVQRQTDLFLCCHRQGDPSCTYLETMSCGVPIVGYDNEAFEGLVKTSGCGWLVPMNDARAMATKVAEISRDREQMREAAFASLEFAAANTFEATFARRVTHLKGIARDAIS